MYRGLVRLPRSHHGQTIINPIIIVDLPFDGSSSSEDVPDMLALRHLDAELAPFGAEVGRGSKQVRMPTLAIRAKVHSKGIHAAIQARPKLLFDTATDTFVFLDHNASDSITSAELERGFRRLGVDATIRDLGFNYIHIIEFLRLYAWHDIKNIEDLEYAVGASRLNAAKLRAKALERVEALSTAAAAEDNADPSSTSECAEKEEDVMDLMKVKLKESYVVDSKAESSVDWMDGQLVVVKVDSRAGVRVSW